jgi:hypothetical protein
MKGERMKKLVGVAAVVSFLAGGVAVAQQPAPSPAPGHGSGQPTQSPSCSMMGGMMSGGMMSGGSMMSMAQAENPRMVQMRGEMLKAMGEVMVKYGKMMETAK